MNDPMEVYMLELKGQKGEVLGRPENVLITSFSANHDSDVLWKKYGDCYEGIRLKYTFSTTSVDDYSFADFDGVPVFISPVSYLDKATLFSKLSSDDYSGKRVIDLLSQKELNWEEEQEVRGIFFQNENVGKKGVPVNVAIPREWLLEVEIGKRANRKSRAVFTRCIRHFYGKRVKIT
jgi:hypothetical protein